MSLKKVLTPIEIGGVTIPNRVVRTAHATGLGPMNDALIAYHRARAVGGVGLTIVEILSVHPTSPASLNAFDPAIGDGYARLVDAVRPHGMKLFQQIWHAGHNSLPIDGSPPWSSSDVPSTTVGVVPLAMTKGMIDEIVGAYADAVRKCAAWGMNGAEIHCAHGYLPAQFLSAAINRRDDDYGGSIDNRARFAIEVLAACRDAVPKGFALGVRVAPDMVTGGAGIDENGRLVELLEARSLIDFVDVSLGNYQTFPKMIGGMHEPAGYELPTSEPITRLTGLPTIVTGRVRTLEEADQIIRDGAADLVGMTRAHIADPAIVSKTLAGHPEQVRPCIACNQGCVGNLLSPKRRMECVVNPGAGFETSVGDDHLIPAVPRRVLVVGGGPAGMEAARVAALRGHQVTLAEAEPELGGALKLAARAPKRHGFGDLLVWLEQEVFRLGVEVRLSTYIEADEIVAEGFDAVIVATGAQPRMDGRVISAPGLPIQGVDGRNVISTHDLFRSPASYNPARAVVIDDLGHYEGIAAAEQLTSSGAAVACISRHPSFAPLVESALMVEPALERLALAEFEQLARHRAVRIERDAVIAAPVYMPAGSGERRIPADLVVVVTANRPDRSLAQSLAGKVEVTMAGDARSPRFLQQVIREGHLAGATI
ncbi:FAD-dependent oxidoreductase [Novosphingobium tardum]|uniref:FAD-dependent oxidoreductase n=1 Tax=Novosphingobium tardum TaxID=1538021 RepID=A0ABV8RUF6_9SPHN